MHSDLNLPSYKLHDSFSVDDCTFLDKEKGVVYSPLAAETLLCDKYVIHFISELDTQDNTSSSVGAFLEAHPTSGENVISQLVSMKIIELEN